MTRKMDKKRIHMRQRKLERHKNRRSRKKYSGPPVESEENQPQGIMSRMVRRFAHEKSAKESKDKEHWSDLQKKFEKRKASRRKP